MHHQIIRFFLILVTAVTMAACASSGGSSANSSPAKSPTSTTSYAITDNWVEVEDMIYNMDYQDAINRATEIMDSEGRSVHGLTLRGIAYAKFDKQFAAFADLIEASQMDRNPDTLINIGNALRMFGHCDRAIDAYKQALALAPGDVEILINMTSAYLCLGDLDMANQALKDTLKDFPKDAVSYTNVAILKHQIGDAKSAREAAQKAIEFDTSYAPAYQALYQACVTLKDNACATEAQRQHKSLIGINFKNKKHPRRR